MKKRTFEEFEQFLDDIIDFGSYNKEKTKIIICDDIMFFYDESDMIVFSKVKEQSIIWNVEYIAKTTGKTIHEILNI